MQIRTLAFQVFYKVLFHAAAVLPASKTCSSVCMVLYNFIVKPAQRRIAAQLAHSCFFYLLRAAPCHAVGLAHFPQGLLLVIPAAQYIGFPVGQLCKGFFQGAVQLFLE